MAFGGPPRRHGCTQRRKLVRLDPGRGPGTGFEPVLNCRPGLLREVPEVLAGRSASRPLLVTDRGMASSPAVAALLATIRDAGMDPLHFSKEKKTP